MSLPGFMRLSGSQSALNSRKASTSSGPNILGSSAARACPSPCSPENDPPKRTTRSAARSINSRKLPFPPRVEEIEVDAHVHAALAVVAVERAAIAVFVHQLRERAQVVRRARAGGTAASSQPSQRSARRAQTPPRPAPTPARTIRCRLLRRADAPWAGPGQRLRRARGASAWRCASSRVQAPNSTSRKPTPGGSMSRSFERQALAAHESTSRSVEASSPMGLCSAPGEQRRPPRNDPRIRAPSARDAAGSQPG